MPAEQKATPKAIKFDSKSDIQMRFRAHHSHDLAKQLRDAGLRFIRVSPIEKAKDLVAQFRISKKSKAQQIIISLTGTEYKDKSLIDDYLAYFLTSNDYVVSHHGKYNTGKVSTYFFIVEPVNQQEDDKEMRADLLGYE